MAEVKDMKTVAIIFGQRPQLQGSIGQKTDWGCKSEQGNPRPETHKSKGPNLHLRGRAHGPRLGRQIGLGQHTTFEGNHPLVQDGVGRLMGQATQENGLDQTVGLPSPPFSKRRQGLGGRRTTLSGRKLRDLGHRKAQIDSTGVHDTPSVDSFDVHAAFTKFFDLRSPSPLRTLSLKR